MLFDPSLKKKSFLTHHWPLSPIMYVRRYMSFNAFRKRMVTVLSDFLSRSFSNSLCLLLPFYRLNDLSDNIGCPGLGSESHRITISLENSSILHCSQSDIFPRCLLQALCQIDFEFSTYNSYCCWRGRNGSCLRRYYSHRSYLQGCFGWRWHVGGPVQSNWYPRYICELSGRSKPKSKYCRM